MASSMASCVIGPAGNQDEDVTSALWLICFRDWCQEQVVMFTMPPADYNEYAELTWNYFNRVTPYVEFRRQMVVLLQNSRHVQVYWDVFHCWSMGTEQLVDYSLLFYPIYLCRQLNLIPAFANAIFGDTELWNKVPQCSRVQAHQLAAQPAAELARQLDFHALAEANSRLYSYP